MSKNNEASKKGNDGEYDPLEELNEIDDNFTIETEKDFFDEIEQSNLENIPEYDSESGKIIEESDKVSKKADNLNNPLLEEIEKADINNSPKAVESESQKNLTNDVKPQKPNKTPKKGKKFDLSSKLGFNKKEDKKPIARPKKQVHTFNEKKESSKDDTKFIDNVKVDDDGVPLLNQFDTEKIKDSKLMPKVTVRKTSVTKILMIIAGILITLFGIFQAMNDVVRISDHVMYGEHESMAIGLIFLGIILIILAFYKEIMNLVGLNNLNHIVDDVDSSSKPRPKNRKYNKK